MMNNPPILRVPSRKAVSLCALLPALAVTAVALGMLLSRGRFVQAQAGDSAQTPAAEPAAPAPGDSSAPVPPEGSGNLGWGAGYLQWPAVTGYVLSRSHGSRLALIRATPLASARIRARNAESIRHLKLSDVKSYPVGTVIAMETWEIGADDSRGAPGPVFFMKKEPPGYDPQAGDWRYAMTRMDGLVLAEGKDGRATACRTCHASMKALDFVPAIDR